jgi:hypothetical protein
MLPSIFAKIFYIRNGKSPKQQVLGPKILVCRRTENKTETEQILLKST